MDLLLVLKCASAGLKLIPVHGIGESGRCTCGKTDCPSAGKHPILRQWTKEGSSDVLVLGKWFGLDGPYRSHNVGIVTGAASGVFVLDIDSKAGGLITLSQLEAAHGEIIAPCVKTGGGGLHFFFKMPPGRRVVGTVGVYPGIDIRADGNFVVCPPSRHVSGGTYAWVDDDEPFEPPEAPEWLLERLGKPAERAPSSIISERIPLHSRDNTLTSLAGTLRRRGLDENVILGCLRVINSLCDPPCDEPQLKKVATSVSKYAPGDPIRTDERAIPSLFTSFTAIKAMDIPPPAWLMTGICLTKGFHLLAGAPNSYKSWLALSACLALTGGKHLSSSHLAAQGRGRALYVACEGPTQFLRRIKLLAVGMEVDPGDAFQVIAANPNLGSGDRRNEFAEAVGSLDPALVVLDPLRSLFGLREDTQEGWQPIISWLLALAADRSVLVSHHLRKTPAGADETLDMSAVSGPGLLISAADYILINRKTEPNEFEVLNVKSRDTQLADRATFKFVALPNLFRLEHCGDRPQDKTNPKDAILTALRGGVTLSASKLMAATVLSERIVKTALYQLQAEGKVQTTGRYGICLASENPVLEEKKDGLEGRGPEGA